MVAIDEFFFSLFTTSPVDRQCYRHAATGAQSGTHVDRQSRRSLRGADSAGMDTTDQCRCGARSPHDLHNYLAKIPFKDKQHQRPAAVPCNQCNNTPAQ
jgi:hypothetical protein